MIKSIKLKSGSTVGKPALELELTPVTVFVGPNNSGKSKVLMEIEKLEASPANLILDSYSLMSMEEKDIMDDIEKLKVVTTAIAHPYVRLGRVLMQKRTGNVDVNEKVLIKEAQDPSNGNATYLHYLRLYSMRLDGNNRLNLINPQSMGDLLETPTNSLSYLFANDPLRKEVRRIIFDAFGKYYVLDPTSGGNFRIRLSDIPPLNDRTEKGLDLEAIDFHKQASLISVASDGVRAFTGIITTILAGEPKLILIDEPEAFLHPALANKLGKEVSTSLRGTEKRLIISTHSSSFLMGCIQSGTPLNIVRLTYNKEIATSRLLPKDKILHLMRHPLLRSTGVLNGLFYESVVVTESDSDRAFYQEINERLLAENDPRSISNCLFINAQNKQTVWDIVKPLRELGIPTIGIVDLDVLKEGGTVFNKLLVGAHIPNLSHSSITAQRKTLLENLNTLGDWKRLGGIELMDKPNMEAADSYFDNLDNYGAFIVRNGELESWLKELGATGHGSNWLINVFEKMGEDPSGPDYLKPSENDVWAFMGKIKNWITNNDRKGIPD